MKFPKQELDIDVYLQTIKECLFDNTCHIFIDTNIISQLYRLNDDARNDFYNWVNSCKDRFHIPNWSVLEYSKRATTQKTGDYLSELTQAKRLANELTNIKKFSRGYVGNSLLKGTSYDGRADVLFREIDSVVQTFESIANAISKNLEKHQQNVHKEVLEKLNEYTINTNIYKIIEQLCYEHELRFGGEVPPGFKDSGKNTNRIGDLIIWKEIIDFCEKESIKKTIFISRDMKPDMVYTPINQKRGGYPVRDNDDKIKIAQESLVYEYGLATGGSEAFYLISFYTLVKILAPTYQKLAVSFQITSEQENTQFDPEDRYSIEGESVSDGEEAVLNEKEEKETIKTEGPYSAFALADAEYDVSEASTPINKYIEKLKSHNWYKQNPAIDELRKIDIDKIDDNQRNIDSIFVLGRNVLQSAEGTSGNAIWFLDNLHSFVSSWPESFLKAFIDGCFYEVFFDSSGMIRSKGFKASYFQTLVNEAEKTGRRSVFNFINSELSKIKTRFVPEVHGDRTYSFKFSFDHGNNTTTSLTINGIDVSNTFEGFFGCIFSDTLTLKNELASYYAIIEDNIVIESLPETVKKVHFIYRH